jgi:hypothetical protein
MALGKSAATGRRFTFPMDFQVFGEGQAGFWTNSAMRTTAAGQPQDCRQAGGW